MRKYGWIALLVLLVGLLALPLWLSRQPDETARSSLVAEAAVEDLSGFARATGPAPLQFPQDHGPHPDYQTEWWYYTGNLATESGRRFGYQLTFFRRALLPPSEEVERASDWGTRQVYMAHFALTDVAGEQHQAFERLSRGAAGLAGAQALPFSVWLDDWQVSQQAEGGYRLQAEAQGESGPLALNLRLEDTTGPVLQGDRGYSQKGPDPGQASYYYSLPRLITRGEVRLGSERFAVSGSSWMDHEYSTSALSADQIGWDWFSLQLDDGSELMVFQIRRADGSIDPFSSGTLIAPDGSTRPLQRDDFHLEVTHTWNSPRSGATYPAGWRLTIPGAGPQGGDLQLQIEPLLADQEMDVSYTYWEGAVRASGSLGVQPVQAVGYVEMTGYAASMGGEF